MCVCVRVSCVYIYVGGLYLIGGVFPVGAVVLIFGVIVAIIVACTSRNDKRPIYHCVGLITPSHVYVFISFFLQAFAWLGFAIAVVWIYIIANEIVNLLQV